MASVVLPGLLVLMGMLGAAQAQTLTLTKLANQANFIAAGQVLTYNFTVTNTGVDTLTNVMVTDPLATLEPRMPSVIWCSHTSFFVVCFCLETPSTLTSLMWSLSLWTKFEAGWRAISSSS